MVTRTLWVSDSAGRLWPAAGARLCSLRILAGKMASSSGESAGTVLTALHQAISEQNIFIDACNDPSEVARAVAAREAFQELHAELSQLGSSEILQELTLRTPAAASWLPKSLQRFFSIPMLIGKAISEEVSRAPGDAHASHSLTSILRQESGLSWRARFTYENQWFLIVFSAFKGFSQFQSDWKIVKIITF